MPHLGQSFGFNLANAFTGDVEVPPNLIEGGGLSVAQPIAHLDDRALPLVEPVEHILEILDIEF